MSSRRIAAQVARGFCMGSADVVPGVSGGTVALVFGIYRDLVAQVSQGAHALGRLARADVRGALERVRGLDLGFLLPLLAGIGIAVLSLARVVEWALEEHPIRTAAVFFGLVAGSLAVTARLVTRWTTEHAALLVGIGVVTFFLLGLRSGPANDPALWFVAVAGAIAICAMILPGISGSFLLLMLGVYDYVIDVVNDRDLAVAAVFGAGAVFGLAGFSSLLNWALMRHEQLMLAGLIGLMAGSLRVLWPWPHGTEDATLAAPADDVLVPIVLAAAAAVLVMVVARFAARREQAEHLEAV